MRPFAKLFHSYSSRLEAQRRSAIEAILAADPIEVPADPVELRRELDEARGLPPG